MNKYKFIIATIASLLIVFLGLLPWLTDDNYQGKVELEFNTGSSEIWSFVNDVRNIPLRLPKISKVESLDSSQRQHLFKIYTHDNDWMLLKSTTISDTVRTLTFLQSSFGYTGVWQYRIRDLGNETCKVFMEERSQLNNYGLKLLMLIVGRDMLMAEEMRGIQFMAKEGL